MSAAGCKPDPVEPKQVDRDDPSISLTAIRDRLATGDVVEARQRAYTLSLAHPDEAEVHVVLASAYTLEARYNDAITASRRAVELKPKQPGAWVTLGVALEGLGRFKEAVEATQHALKWDTQHVGAMRNLMRLYRRLGATDEERRVLKTLIIHEPADPELRLLLAHNHAATGDFVTAVTHAREALERAPDNGDIHTFLAAGLYATDKLKAAMDHAVIALRLNPERADAQDVFRAAFYVEVSRAMTCTHGQAPWRDDALDAMLQTYASHGVSDVASFHDLQGLYGKRPEVQERIIRASQSCLGDGAPTSP